MPHPASSAHNGLARSLASSGFFTPFMLRVRRFHLAFGS
jgi:hypothetical protein